MPVSIVQVMNNTSSTLHYQNRVTRHNIEINGKTQQCGNNDWIPSSNFYDDTVPYRSSGGHIAVWLGDGPTVEISDDDWKFRIVGPVPDTRERAADRYGDLTNRGQYILRLDEVNNGRSKACSLTFLKYEDKYKVTGGSIASQLIQHAAPLVALILMAIFL